MLSMMRRRSHAGIVRIAAAKDLPPTWMPRSLASARDFLRGEDIVIEPRLRWPTGLFPDKPKTTIPSEERVEPGRVLSLYADGGWGRLVRVGKYEQRKFGDELVDAAMHLIRDRWKPEPAPAWVTAIPSFRHPILVRDFAERLANRLDLPFAPQVLTANEVPEQKTMANSPRQSRNAFALLRIDAAQIRPGPVLLVDDMIDSRWTMTVAGWLLRSHGPRRGLSVCFGPIHSPGWLTWQCPQIPGDPPPDQPPWAPAGGRCQATQSPRME